MVGTANGHATKLCSPEDVANTIRLLIEPGGVTELRALDATTAADNWPATQSGYFNDADKLAEAVSRLRSAKGIYFIPNPVDGPLMARASNRMRKTPKGESTADTNIVSRRWLLIDCDPVRPSGILSTDAEHVAALDLSQKIDLYLHDRDWPQPVAGDSGNGAHLLFQIDLPTDDGGLVQRVLNTLAGVFNDATVKVDTSVFNPARIWKLYGTLTCKGDSTENRPHRMAKILSQPDNLVAVSREQLEAFVAEHAAPEPARPQATGSFDLDGFIARHLEVDAPAAWKGSGSIWNLTTSPLCDHGGDGPFIGRQPDGAIVAGCHHDSCKGRWGWSDLREMFEPKPEWVHDGGDRWTRKEASAGDTTSTVGGDSRGFGCVGAKTVPSTQPFPVDSLPSAVAEYVKAATSAIGCDLSIIALPFICCLGRAIGNSRVIRLKNGWNETSVIWGAVVAPSGSHKSPAIDKARQFLDRIQDAQYAQHQQALEQYAIDKSLYERNYAEWKRGKTNDPPPEEPIEPAEIRYITSDATVEAIIDILAKQFDGVLLHRDELSGWLHGLNEYKGGKGSDLGHWLSMWSAGSLQVNRKSGPTKSLRVKRAAVGLLGGIQPGVLRDVIGKEHCQDGLIARFLLTMPEPHPVRWSDAEVDWAIESRMTHIFSALTSLEPVRDEHEEFQPAAIPLSPPAKRIWVDFFNEHRAESVELDDDLRACWSKLEAYAARLALIIHLCEWASENTPLDEISAKSITAGIKLAGWFGNEAKRVYGLFGESSRETELRELADLIRRRGGRISARDLQNVWSRKIRTANEAETLLDALHNAGYGHWEHLPPGPKGGRPTRVFVLSTPSTQPKTSQNPANQ